MNDHDVALLFSGDTDSLALYALSTVGREPDLPKARHIHLLHMLNGMSRFHDFPKKRFETGQRILSSQVNSSTDMPDTSYLELDTGRLFQGLWLDRFEELMPLYNHKNLVCIACKAAMHARAVLYCNANSVPLLVTGYTSKQSYYPEQTPVFMDKMSAFSEEFGVTTTYPVYDEFNDQIVTRHLLEDFGLPSSGGGERKCLFCQTLTTTTEKEIGCYLDDMIPKISQYMQYKLSGQVKKAAEFFHRAVHKTAAYGM